MTLVLLLDLREYSPLIKYKAGFPRLIPQISTKSMFIWKVKEDFLDSEIVDDKWRTEFKENAETGEEELIEIYMGQTPIGKTNDQKYLGL